MGDLRDVIEDATEIDGGWRLHSTETHHVDVLSMLYNDRVAWTPVGQPAGLETYERYWCYPKGGAAFHAAVLWDGSADTEPVGWIKSWDQRYTNPSAGQRGVDGKRVE